MAATLQRPPAALELVSSPPAFPPAAYVGLDARLGPPPWLRPDEWMCWDSHRLWEAHAVATLADAATPPENALGLLMREAEVLRQSDPATLLEHIAALDAAPRAGLALPALNPFALHDLVVACVPAGDAVPAPRAQLEPALERWVAPAWSMHAHAIRRYLAAKAVANWCAVQGDGLRTAVWFLVVAWAVLRVEAARVCAARATALDPAGVRAAAAAADLLLIHLVALERLAARLSQVERSPVWPPPPHGSV